MNSLEFIKQNIFDCKNHIEHLEIEIIENEKYSTLVKKHKERIEELKPILNILQQIKVELEAWEVVADKIFYGGGRCLIDSSVWFGEEAETIKKAMEVKNDNSNSKTR